MGHTPSTRGLLAASIAVACGSNATNGEPPQAGDSNAASPNDTSPQADGNGAAMQPNTDGGSGSQVVAGPKRATGFALRSRDYNTLCMQTDADPTSHGSYVFPFSENGSILDVISFALGVDGNRPVGDGSGADGNWLFGELP